ncbi:MAG: hypothetical protein GWO02_18970 [Gammaproteobacteria bacterium]|nr:hypothetical protein [Gammaproteobacteria bacterium]
MRDIRGDLQDRAGFLEEQISAAEAQFDKRLEQLKREHQAKIEDLQSELEAVTTLMEREYERLGSAPVREERPRQAPPVAERHPAPEPRREPYRRPQEPELQRRPAEAEPHRRPVRDAEPYRGPAREAEYRRHPEQEPHYGPAQTPAQSESEPQVYRRAPLARDGEREPQRPAKRAAQAPQQPPLADFLIRKLSEMGAMTIDELCQLAVQEGYFTDDEIADRGVEVTLMNVVKAGFIRQQPNGTFAPATVMDTIRLRRAI